MCYLNKTNLVFIICVNILAVHSDYDTGENEQSFKEGYLTGLKKKLGKKCFKDIGCFSGQEFREFKKGVSHLPLAPNYILPEFRIYTKSNNTKKANVLRYNPTIDELKLTNFNPDYRTIVIVHGFQSDLAKWMIAIKDLILDQIYNKYNVVLVSWGRGSKIGSYFLAVANTQVVGALIAFFINRLCQLFDMRNNMFHLIGHSLGAHIMGFAGKRLFNPEVDRITGLDPAGPGFSEGHPSLEKTDAKKVVIIHSDMGIPAVTEGLGNTRIFGDVDFYPNGGKLQPGCAWTAGIYGALKAIANDQAISCSHQRAYDLATSLGKPGQFCLPVGYECPDWETFLEGRCADCGKDNSKCYLMGLYLWYWRGIDFEQQKQEPNKKYFLNTGAVPHYCTYHYQIALHINNDSSQGSGHLNINIEGKVNKKFEDIYIERKLTEIRPGLIHTLLLTLTFRIEEIQVISITWNSIDNFKTQQFSRQQQEEDEGKGKVLNIQLIEFNFMSHIYEKVREKYSAIFCPYDDNGIISGKDDQVDFFKCDNNVKPKHLARNLESSLLQPITNYKDIVAVDYQMIDKVVHKIANSNLIGINFKI